MKRVVIIGCPGAGKTTFARKLTKKLALPLIHLDYYYHQKESDYYNDKGAWIKKVEELIRQPKWIIDGNYSSSFEQRFARADTILFFDFPRRTSISGVMKRRVYHRNKLREDMPSDWKEKANWEFLRYVWKFRGDSRNTILKALEKHKDKTIHTFKNRAAAEKFLNNL